MVDWGPLPKLEMPPITCPFCGEEDFDYVGLKMHFERGHCDEYNKTDTTCKEKSE